MSAYSDDYRTLIEDARSALRALLDASDHDSCSTVRVAYGQLRDALDGDARRAELEEARQEKEARQQEQRAQHLREWEEHREWDRVWCDMPRARRESLVFDVLGDESLLIREIADRANEELARMNRERGLKIPTGISGKILFDSTLRPTVMHMLNAGQLERTPEIFRKTRTRYRFARKRGLDGPIADLERAYHDDREEA